MAAHADPTYFDDLNLELIDHGYYVKGWIALQLGKYEDAEKLLRVYCHEPERLKLLFVWCLGFIAEMHISRNASGDAERARSHLSKKIPIAEECGIVAAVEYGKSLQETLVEMAFSTE